MINRQKMQIMERRNFLQTLAYCSMALGAAAIIPPVSILGNGGFRNSEQNPKRFGDGRDWFFENRFGMFVHWGLYAVPGWHEQHQYRLSIPRREYEKLMNSFNPVDFNPDRWIDLMDEAGMKYLCFTTKHIDGFCMWDTKQTKHREMVQFG